VTGETNAGVCFASWHGFAGCVTSCRHSEAVLGGKAAVVTESEAPTEALDSELLILSAWTPGYAELLERRAGPTVARWHSPLLQTELSREGWKLSNLLELVDNGSLAGLAVSDAAVAAALGHPKIIHLPEVFEPELVAGTRPARLEGVNVSLVGEPHGRKNVLAQSAGFEEARRLAEGEWTLHLFGQTHRRRGYARWLELAGIPHVDHGFLPVEQQLQLLAGMDAALVASLTESYGYAAAEHVALGVPAVVSRAVAALDPGPLTVADPGDVSEIAALLALALAEPQLTADQRAGLLRRAEENASIASHALADLRQRVAALL